MICSRKGCLNEARYRLGLDVYASRDLYPRSPPHQAGLGLLVCEGCKDLTRLGEVLTEKLWKEIFDRILDRGKVPPKREDTRLRFYELGSEEEKALMAQTH